MTIGGIGNGSGAQSLTALDPRQQLSNSTHLNRVGEARTLAAELGPGMVDAAVGRILDQTDGCSTQSAPVLDEQRLRADTGRTLGQRALSAADTALDALGLPTNEEVGSFVKFVNGTQSQSPEQIDSMKVDSPLGQRALSAVDTALDTLGLPTSGNVAAYAETTTAGDSSSSSGSQTLDRGLGRLGEAVQSGFDKFNEVFDHDKATETIRSIDR